MPDKPKNKLSADEILKSDLFSGNGKIKTGKDAYRCDNYIQAMIYKETLETITGNEYVIESCGTAGWKVLVNR